MSGPRPSSPAPATAGGGAATSLSFVALLLAVAALVVALRGDRGPPGPREMDPDDDSDLLDAASLGNRLDDVEARLERVQAAADAAGRRLDAVERTAADARGTAQKALDLARAGGRPGEAVVVEGDDPIPDDEEGRALHRRDLLRELESGALDVAGVHRRTARAADLGALDEAIRAVERAATARPRDPAAHVAVGVARLVRVERAADDAERMLRLQEALDAFDAAIALDGGHWDALYLRAIHLARSPRAMGRRLEAARAFEALAALQEERPQDPEKSDTYVRWAALLDEEGDPDGARRVLRRGAQHFPNDIAIAEALRRLDAR